MNNLSIDKETKELLGVVADFDGESFKGAFNIRSNCQSLGRASSENIKIESKEGASGLEIKIAPGTKGEQVFIPACITKGNVEDLVYNDFFVGEGADVTIVAGCGIHTENGEPSRHSGIHRFFLGKDSRVLYLEKHIGTGEGEGRKSIDPKTECTLEENAYLEMDTSQLGGVTDTERYTTAVLEKGATLIVRERLLTDKEQTAKTYFNVELNGDGSGVNLISRSVARGNSRQEYQSIIVGNAICTGHSECDAILADNGRVEAAPQLIANNKDAALIHEAAIGKIAGEQILKLRTLGLTEEAAETAIIDGFLK
jgi:Fe-S cluster assembly scaffold protein SufB